MVLSTQQDQATIITLLPNRSASWAQTRFMLIFICGMTLAIGVFWAFAGAWVILPFSGIEAALVAFLMYKVSLSTYQRQVITFSPGKVLIQHGRHFPKRSWHMDRESTFLRLTHPRHPYAPLGIDISDGKQDIELGSFLNKQDKEQALSQLKSAGLFVREYREASQGS
tara:strand:- start:12526 stop:13029 length:504 start_codon:yes stop_codon:yes gene_type:complete